MRHFRSTAIAPIQILRYAIGSLIAALTSAATPPPTLLGVFQGSATACLNEIIIVTDKEISMDDCKREKYSLIEQSDGSMSIELTRPHACNSPIMTLERIRPGGESQLISLLTFRSLQDFRAGNAYSACGYASVDPDLANDQTPKFRHGKSPEIRADALNKINLQALADREEYNEQGARDPSAQVRLVALEYLRGRPKKVVAILIDRMKNDADEDVRVRATESLARYYGDFDGPGCEDSDIVRRHLDELLSGLDNPRIAELTADIFGEHGSGDPPLACCLKRTERAHLMEVLQQYTFTKNAIAKAESCGND